MTDRTPDVLAAIECELRLLDPEVRRSPELADALLHPEFVGHGASGRIVDRAEIIREMAGRLDPGVRAATTSRMRGVQLAPDVVLLTFDTDHQGRRAHRSSLWRRTGAGWQLYFHQGTLFTEEGAR